VLYLDFLTYQSGNNWLGVVILGLLALGLYIYLSPRAYTFRYLFPGLFAFSLFVIFSAALHRLPQFHEIQLQPFAFVPERGGTPGTRFIHRPGHPLL